jgi:hypothetical protein
MKQLSSFSVDEGYMFLGSSVDFNGPYGIAP